VGSETAGASGGEETQRGDEGKKERGWGMSNAKEAAETKQLLDAIATFLRGYQVDHPDATAWNDGISTVISQMYDEQDNADLISAMKSFAEAYHRSELSRLAEKAESEYKGWIGTGIAAWLRGNM
jgi:regulator of RNase E activity RraB